MSEDRFAEVRQFSQHGYLPIDENDTQIWGTCPFCGKDKLYIHKKTHNWDCKVCGEQGGFQTYLRLILQLCQENFKGKPVEKLVQSRHLPEKIFKTFGVGFNPLTKAYTIPIYSENGNTILDLRMFTNGRLIGTKSCNTGLLNSALLLSKEAINEDVYICEGEWDGMAMRWLLDSIGKGGVVVSVPGAGVLKPNWVQLFKDRNVIALYDNDDPGRKGSVRCYNMLKAVTKSLRFLHWPAGVADKYDIRDLVTESKDKKKVMAYIESNLQDLPTGELKETEGSSSAPVIFDGAGVTAETVREKFAHWLHMEDDAVIDIMFGAVLANRLPGDPIWLFLITPPGMGKTTYLGSLTEAKGIEAMTTLTPNTLVSGMTGPNGSDPSLLPRLDGKVLVIKDFTTILNMNQQAREEIFGILRDAYDGETKKIFGNMKVAQYKSKFGIVAGVTPVIDMILDQESALGERFLRFEIPSPVTVGDHIAFLKRAAENVTFEETMSSDLRAITEECLNYQFDCEVKIPPEIEDVIINMAVLIAMMRGTVPRDKFTKEVVSHPFFEMGTRLSKTMIKLMMGICMFRRKKMATEYELERIRKVARSTIPRRIYSIMKIVYPAFKDTAFTLQEASELIRLPAPTVQRQLESLILLGIIDKRDLGKLKAAYGFSRDALELFTKTKLIE